MRITIIGDRLGCVTTRLATIGLLLLPEGWKQLSTAVNGMNDAVQPVCEMKPHLAYRAATLPAPPLLSRFPPDNTSTEAIAVGTRLRALQSAWRRPFS